MSRASKVFLASSAAICGVSIWGVHWLQERESDGVIKDEARMKAKALSRSAASAIGLSSPSPSSSSFPSSSQSTSTSIDALPPLTAGPSLLTGAANTTGASASLSSTPSPVVQPAPVMDEDCETCRISPPPQLLEAQSAEQRRIEREARAKEYNEQKDLAARLRREQGQSQEGSGAGRVLDQTASSSGDGRLV